MKITQLKLENFRLIRDASIELASGANVFLGENAQGKTSILEAVSYLSTGRSFRTTRDKDCISHSNADEIDLKYAAVECEYQLDKTYHRVRGAITADTKTFWNDGQQMPRLGDLWGLLNAVLFVPSDTELVQGGPTPRRGLISSLLARASRADLQTMQRYAAALRQRNALLKEARLPGDAHFEAYEQQMAESGARMLASRQRLIRNLSPMVKHYVQLLASGSDNFEIRHETGCPNLNVQEEDVYAENHAAFEELVQWLRFLWVRDRPRDRERGSTQHGPHRGDMALVLNGKDARAFASQGQARTLVLALRLAEVNLLKSLTGNPPILLLDDVMGDLDQSRARQFIHLVAQSGSQALLTATDAAVLERQLPINARFVVKAGKVEHI